MDPKPPQKNRFVLDTSFLAICCADKSVGREMSQLDIDYNKMANGNNPDKLRSKLIQILTDNIVIVPEIVRQELQGLASKGSAAKTEGRRQFSDSNIQKMRCLVAALENRTTDLLPTYQDVLLQKSIWDRVQRDPDQGPWKRKFEEHATKVSATARQVLKDLPEPWLQAEQQIQELRKLELSRPSKQTSDRLAAAETTLRETRPKLVPDFEIMLTGLKCNAGVISRDGDFGTMWKAAPDEVKAGGVIPRVFQKVNDISEQPKSIGEVANAIQNRVRPFVVRKKPEPDR
jgi:hypothetical protein